MSERSPYVCLEDERLAGLTPSQMMAFTALLSGATQIEAASAAGVSRHQVARWMHDDLIFRVNFKREKLAIMRTALAGIASGSLEAVNFLRATLSSSDADTNQKLKAATLLLTSSGVDRAPATWPTLNDVELMVASELDDVVKHSFITKRELEAVEVEKECRKRYDPEVVAKLKSKESRLAKEIDRRTKKLRKLQNHRQLTPRQADEVKQLKNRIDGLELEHRHVSAAAIELQLLAEGARDLQLSGESLRLLPERQPHLVALLRQQQEMDG